MPDDRNNQMEFTFTQDDHVDQEKSDLISKMIRTSVPEDGFLPVFGNNEGYQKWRQANHDKIQMISNEWGVNLNKKVRIQLFGLPCEIVGYIVPLEIPKEIDRSKGPLKLRLYYQGTFALGQDTSTDFTSVDIETCHLVNGGHQ